MLSTTTTYNVLFRFQGATPATLTTNGTVLGEFGMEIDKAGSSLNGQVYISDELKATLLNTSRTKLTQNPIDLLSDRELEVMEYVAIGMGTKEIAQKMNLDITTISTYRRRAFEKLDVQNTIELKEKFLLYKT